MAYWACARLEPHRERLAVHCLELNGYEVYLPRLRERRMSHGRRIEVRPPLFPGYAFIAIELQWHTARRLQPAVRMSNPERVATGFSGALKTDVESRTPTARTQ